mmetsp:Transcript_19377/g.68582  ORF Transcript_19377/g.68582 Transcript_19377/m.68582 type:complete len:233 (-) Transcript_19377:2922-3620(-)
MTGPRAIVNSVRECRIATNMCVLRPTGPSCSAGSLRRKFRASTFSRLLARRPPLEHQDVVAFSNNTIGRDLSRRRIVEIVPLAVNAVDSACRVMPPSETATVIRHSVQVVHGVLVCRRRRAQVRSHIDPLERHCHFRVDSVAIMRRVRKALEVHDEDFRQREQPQLLERATMLLALRAVPHVTLAELFRGTPVSQARIHAHLSVVAASICRSRCHPRPLAHHGFGVCAPHAT